MQEGLADFLRRFENNQATPHVDALRASTPHSLQSRRFPDFGYQASPVGREEVSHPQHNTLPHTRSARTEDSDSMETHMGARCRTSRVRALGMKRRLEKRATRCRTPVVRAQGNNCCSGTRAPGIRTTVSGTRAPGIRTTFGTRAPYNFVLTNDLHMRMTEETVEGYSRVHITRATPYRFHASHQARKFRHLMAQIRPSSVLRLFNLRP